MIYHRIFSRTLIVCSCLLLLNGCASQVSEQVPTRVTDNYPAGVALASLGATFQESATPLQITQRVSAGEFPEHATVTIEVSGLLDDSIAAEKYVFDMSYNDNLWQINNLVKTHQCLPERGHQDFSPSPCH